MRPISPPRILPHIPAARNFCPIRRSHLTAGCAQDHALADHDPDHPLALKNLSLVWYLCDRSGV